MLSLSLSLSLLTCRHTTSPVPTSSPATACVAADPTNRAGPPPEKAVTAPKEDGDQPTGGGSGVPGGRGATVGA